VRAGIAGASAGLRRALVAAALLATAALARAQDRVEVAWHGKTFPASSPPAELGEAPKSAIAEWKEWAAKAGYRMELDAAGRVLLLQAEKGSHTASAMTVVGRAEAWFDETLPLLNPPPIAAKETKPKASGASAPPKEIPEDPESAPPVLEPPKGAKGGTRNGGAQKPAAATTPWGSGSFAPDSRTAVLIALADEKDQESALGYLAKKHPDISAWAAKAGSDLGFVIENPLLAAFVESASGQEEWNPEHEILNRLVRLLVLSRFGQMPNWVMHSVAWEAETAFDGSIWVYPYRSEFVFTTEHTAWPLELAHEFQERAKKPLAIEELTAWTRGTWDGASARHAFGFMHWLAATKRQALPQVLADLRANRDENNRKTSDDGTWTRNPDWESPPGAQLAILKARCGENALAEAGTWLARQGGSKSHSIERK
jgi:hypothetical protein